MTLYLCVQAVVNNPGTRQLRPAPHAGPHRAEGPHPLPQVRKLNLTSQSEMLTVTKRFGDLSNMP